MKSTTKNHLESIFLNAILHEENPESPIVFHLKKQFTPMELREVAGVMANAIAADDRLKVSLSHKSVTGKETA
ncbi:hypothetical protein ACVBEJ_00115 [Porticoccus sp. GXU_MW_L64]